MRVKLTLALLLIAALGGTVQAQGNLNYGDTVIGSLSANAPLAFFTFNGAAGDRVTVVAIGITPGLDPAISLNSPAQQQLANNDNDPTSPGTTDARVTITLAQPGLHTILVNSVSGVPGEFLIRLFGQPAVPATDVSNAPANTVISGATQVFSFNAASAAPLTVTVSTITPGFGFRASVFDPNGQPVAILSGSVSAGASLNIAPGTGVYTVEVAPIDRNLQGQVVVSVGSAAPVPQPLQPQPDVPVPAATEEVTVPDDVCAAGSPSNSRTNVRSGPSTDFSVLTSLAPGERLAITGLYSGWYRVDVPGIGVGWVSSSVVAAYGPCNTIPPVNASEVPAAPQQQPVQATPIYTATTAQQQPVQATPTYTATTSQQQQPVQATPTYTATPTATATMPVAAQVAPDDARFNDPLNIPLDNTASVLNVVSYPGGDSEDRVRWDITGMNQTSTSSGGQARLVISATCSGEGSQHIQFFTGGRTFGCGQTLVDQEVTFNSKTGSVVITAVGGEGTYVQWVLTGTATRTN